VKIVKREIVKVALALLVHQKIVIAAS